MPSVQGPSWSPLREYARDDSLTAAARKYRGRLRLLDVSGCAELTHGAVIEVLRTNPWLTHVTMDEGESDDYKLRLRPRHVRALARTLGARWERWTAAAPSQLSLSPPPPPPPPPVLEVSVEVAGNKELEHLCELLVAGKAEAESEDVSTLGLSLIHI